MTWNISNVGPVADPLASAYGVSLATVGLFTTALFATHMLAQLPGGRAADRIGARRVGLLAVGFVVAGNLVALAAPEPALALVGRAIVGVGSGAGFIAGSDYMRAASASPLLQGLYGGSTMAGGGLAIAIVPQIEGSLGWRTPYWTALAAALTVGVILLAAPVDSRGEATARRGLLVDRRLVGLAAVHAASFGSSIVVANWVVELLTHHGQPRRIAAVLGALVLLAGIVTRPLGGYIVRRRPGLTRRTAALGIVAGTAGTLALALPLPLALLGLAAAVTGLAAGLPFAAVFSRAQAVRPDAPGAAIGFVNAWAVLTIVVGVPLVGLTFSLPGDGRIGFAAIGAAGGTALVAARRTLS